MVKEKTKKVAVGGMIKDISYKTGFLCKKVAELGKYADKKPLKSVVVATQDICESFGEKAEVVLDKVTKTVEKSTREIRASFKAGMDPVGQGHAEHNASVAKKEEVVAEPVIVKKKAAVKKVKPRAAVRKAKAVVDLDLEKEIEAVTKNVKDV